MEDNDHSEIKQKSAGTEQKTEKEEEKEEAEEDQGRLDHYQRDML